MHELQKKLQELRHTHYWSKVILAERQSLLFSASTDLAKSYYTQLINDSQGELAKHETIIGKLSEKIEFLHIRQLADKKIIVVQNTGYESLIERRRLLLLTRNADRLCEWRFRTSIYIPMPSTREEISVTKPRLSFSMKLQSHNIYLIPYIGYQSPDRLISLMWLFTRDKF